MTFSILSTTAPVIFSKTDSPIESLIIEIRASASLSSSASLP